MTAEVKVREATTSTVAGNADALIDLSHRIHANPEVAW